MGKRKYYQKTFKTIYRSKQTQPVFVRNGVKGATTLIGSASILLGGAPMSFAAEEVMANETVEVSVEETLATDTTKESTEESSKEDASTSTDTDSEDTKKPTESEEPTNPETPEKPVEPNEPNKPIKPEKPVEPTEPEKPVKPTEPVTPEQPAKPTQPSKPAQPTQPSKPATTTAPEKAASSAPAAQASQPIVSQVETQPVTELVPETTVASDGSIHFEKDESVETFIKKIGEPARKIGQKEDLYASVMIAQAILESASGTSQLAQAPNYNLFGIKGSYKGKSATFNTQEDTGGGNMTTIQASFRAYENYEESFDDYAKLMKEGLTGNSTFYSGAWKSNTETYEDATRFLTGKYATDTSYNQKLNGLIETYDLTEYDKERTVEVNKQGFVVPVRDYMISSPFGIRGAEFHRGLDMAAVQGEPIYASKAGTVNTAEYHYSWGNYVVIEHEDGMTTLYAHQSQYVVKAGDQVDQGQIIGYVGSTGNSTGSHLHFEVCLDGSLSQAQLIDPTTVLF